MLSQALKILIFDSNSCMPFTHLKSCLLRVLMKKLPVMFYILHFCFSRNFFMELIYTYQYAIALTLYVLGTTLVYF